MSNTISYLVGSCNFDFDKNTCEICFDRPIMQWLCFTNDIHNTKDFTNTMNESEWIHITDMKESIAKLDKHLGFDVMGTTIDKPFQDFNSLELDKINDYFQQWNKDFFDFLECKEQIIKFNNLKVYEKTNDGYVAKKRPLWEFNALDDAPHFVSFNGVGCDENAIQCFDTKHLFHYRKLNPQNVDFDDFFDSESGMGYSLEYIKELQKNGDVLKISDDKFLAFLNNLPTIFQTQDKAIDPLEQAILSPNSSFVMLGDNRYKSEYARYLIERAAHYHGIKFEIDVSALSLANDGIFFSHYDGKWIDFKETSSYAQNYTIFFNKEHDGKDGIDADYVLDRAIFTATNDIEEAKKKANEILETRKDYAYATISNKDNAIQVKNDETKNKPNIRKNR